MSSKVQTPGLWLQVKVFFTGNVQRIPTLRLLECGMLVFFFFFFFNCKSGLSFSIIVSWNCYVHCTYGCKKLGVMSLTKTHRTVSIMERQFVDLGKYDWNIAPPRITIFVFNSSKKPNKNVLFLPWTFLVQTSRWKYRGCIKRERGYSTSICVHSRPLANEGLHPRVVGKTIIRARELGNRTLPNPRVYVYVRNKYENIKKKRKTRYSNEIPRMPHPHSLCIQWEPRYESTSLWLRCPDGCTHRYMHGDPPASNQ